MESFFSNKLYIIIGLPRSGTTLLAELFGRLDCVVLENEPNPVWRYKNYAFLGHEEFSKYDATEEVSRYVRKYFRKKLELHTDKILVEKTPANSLRIEFVRSIFPEAKFIVITRKKENIIRSIVRRVTVGEDKNAAKLDDEKIFRNLRLRINKLKLVSLRDMPAYFSTVLFHISGGILFQSEAFWGPRLRDWKRLMSESVEIRATRQVDTMDASLQKFVAEEPKNTLVICYEDLILNPDEILTEVERFTQLPHESLDRQIIKPE